MTCDVIAFANGGVKGLTPYEPGKPIEDLQRELGLTEIIKLASNESPLGPAPGALEAAKNALLDVARYPDGNGFELKARLAEKLNVAAGQITLGNGSNDVLEFVARAFAGPGTEIVYSEHAFVVYPLSASLVGAKGIAVPARNYGHDLDAMAQAINSNTRVVYIANPNNPTGTWLDGNSLATFIRAVPDEVVVVVDEAYREYVGDEAYPDCVKWLEDTPNLVVTRTFSKAYGLAGLRVGYAVCHPQIADLLNRVRQPFNVNSVALAAAHAALADEVHLKRAIALNNKGLAYLEGELKRLKLPFIASIGNFISFELPGDALPVYQALLREGVIVRPIGAYGMPRHLRVSVGLEDENRRFVQALESVLA